MFGRGLKTLDVGLIPNQIKLMVKEKKKISYYI
jgi:hypothetical protein